MEAVSRSCQQMSLLTPIARHGALVYNAMCHIGGGISPQSMLSWQHFVDLYSKALSEYAATQHRDMAEAIISEGSNRVTVFDDIIQRINQTLLQDAFRFELIGVQVIIKGSPHAHAMVTHIHNHVVSV